MPWNSQCSSLLEFAESGGVPARWSCRSGVCHVCESVLIEGQVSYSPVPLDAPLKGNLLICCARPDDSDRARSITQLIFSGSHVSQFRIRE